MTSKSCRKWNGVNGMRKIFLKQCQFFVQIKSICCTSFLEKWN